MRIIVARRDKSGCCFTADELIEIAKILAQMEHLQVRLLHKFNGRVLVKWLDPMLSFGKANRFFSKLRSALEEDWIDATGSSNGTPFYGEAWHRIYDALGPDK